jgi:protoporphyrinogen oxidase
MSENIIIIGGGPAGLAAGYELTRNNKNCAIFEKENLLGGIAKTIEYKGYYFDQGGHRFFTKNDEINRIWHESLKQDFLKRPRLSRIYYKNKFYSYPIKLPEVIRNLGIWQSFQVLVSYFWSKIFPYRKEDSFEQWVSNRFGKKLYNTFFKSYTEKVWGIPCTEIKAEWAAQRIKNLSLVTAVLNAVFGNRGNKIKTLISEFEYPKYGPGMMWNGMAKRITSLGGEVEFGTEITKINIEAKKVKSVIVSGKNGEKELKADHLLSSMPLREMVLKIHPEPEKRFVEAARKLKYRDFLTVALIIDEENMFPDNWIYIHAPEVKLGRIQNFKNWSSFMTPDSKKTCLGLEYFCFEGDDIWNMDDNDLIKLGTEELFKIKLLSDKAKVIDGKVVRVHKAYPVYDGTYKESLEQVKEYLRSISNLQVIGRNGMHRYNNMDHSMLTGLMAAKNIMGGKHDIWDVNADEEYHEERN